VSADLKPVQGWVDALVRQRREDFSKDHGPAMTQIGVIVGTAADMSPEQARGRQADKRSDVWAFGAALSVAPSATAARRGKVASRLS
jgi:serine/threonine protein kinase